jgi:hypothetical protein
MRRHHGGTEPARALGTMSRDLSAARQPLFEPFFRSTRLSLQRERKTLLEAVMNHWRDTMVERPTPDGAAYLTGWTISGIAVIATIVAVWVLGI